MTPSPETSFISGASDDSGETLAAGRYVVVGHLGSGSQGDTLDGVDKREGRPVAIKRFTLRSAKSWKDVELAEREATVLASLNHPGLPRYVEHFEENGALYLVMERVDGESLQSRRKRGQALGHEQVLRFLTDASACLRYLHGHAPPIVHRDIKPGNVILRPDGSYCIVDFGSVRDRLKPEGGSTVVGTFGFMAPEQFQGRAAPGSDVYAVGATALCLLTGREPEDLPHKGLGIDVEAALHGQVDRRLIVALRSMLEPDPDRRAPSVDAALQGARLLESADPAGSRSAEALKQARRARLEAEALGQRERERAEEHVRRVFERQRKQQERHHERQEQHRAEREARRQRKSERQREKRREREARSYASGHWRHPQRPVPPGIVLGLVILIALRIASVATFALFAVLLPLLFTIIAVPGRRERMLQIHRAGQRGLSRAREHIRFQFLGGPLPQEVKSFIDAMDGDQSPRRRVADDPASKPRVSVDTEAEERDLDAEPVPAPRARRD